MICWYIFNFHFIVSSSERIKYHYLFTIFAGYYFALQLLTRDRDLHFIRTWTIQARNRNIEQAQVNGYLPAVMNDMIQGH